MQVLMTGDKGFVGSSTRGLLETRGIEVVGYDLIDGFDIRDLDLLRATVIHHRPSHILHLAAIARFAEADDDPQTAINTNVLGTAHVARVAAEFQIPVVYASTGSVYMPIEKDPPITEEFPAHGNSVYACSKYVGEICVRYPVRWWEPFQLKSAPTQFIILRYAHLYGKEKRGHGLIGGFLERIERGLAPVLYGGRQSNDFCYINDVAEANYLALTARPEAWNEIYNIGTGEELTAEDAGRIICEAADYNGTVSIVHGRTVDPLRFVYDISKAEWLLKFKARYGFREGLEDMLKDGNFLSDGERGQVLETRSL